MFIDFHTHRRILPENSVEIISVHPGKQSPGDWFTTGYHPWWTFEKLSETEFLVLSEASAKKGFLAIGECGLDRLKGPPLNVQMDIFIQQIQLANTLQCPLIVHCVRAFQEVMDVKKQLGKTPWVIHGFVRNKILAGQLLDKGICLSVAPYMNMPVSFRETLEFLPLDMIFLETDSEYSLSIGDRYKIFSELRRIQIREAEKIFFDNVCRFFTWKEMMLRDGLNAVNY
ncbi:MAG: TatD family hydrolase [Saprospiraceae bacterium]|nr:TatD family hydrolase [Saprospiraceae bacterium]